MKQRKPMDTKIKKEKVFARIDEKEHDELREMAERLDVPTSQIVRQGLREKMATIRRELAEKETAATV